LSPDSNGRSPIMWQIELTENVTWCNSATRTSPAQKKAVRAPCQLQEISPPRMAGARKLEANPKMNLTGQVARLPGCDR
jgi:hypothetical protein